MSAYSEDLKWVSYTYIAFGKDLDIQVAIDDDYKPIERDD